MIRKVFPMQALLSIIVFLLSCETPAPLLKKNCNQDLALRTDLPHFIDNMPKGAELHSHLLGAVYAENLLQYAKGKNYFYDLKSHKILKEKKETSILLDEVSTDPKLYSELLSSWSAFDYKGQDGHKHFFDAFTKFKAIPSSEITADILAEIISRAQKQHLAYVEIMVNPFSRDLKNLSLEAESQWPQLQEKDFDALKNYLSQHGFFEKIKKLKQDTDSVEKDLSKILGFNPFDIQKNTPVGLRLLYQTLRTQSPSLVFTRLLLAYHLVSIDSRFAGINFVGPEDSEIAIRDYDLHMNIFAYMHKIYPKVNLSLHAGELTSKLDATGKGHGHIRKAIEIAGAQRIGHGVNILQDPYYEDLLKKMSNKNILVEINLTSNDFILGIKGDQHPLKKYIQFKVPTSLSTDDEGILRTQINKEYLRAVQEQKISYSNLKTMSLNSLQFSFLEDSKKTLFLERLKHDFEKFEASYCQ